MQRKPTKKVVIDPGHGGSDPGTVANGIIEKDYTLKISKYIYDRLKELGIDVSLTRDSDITLDSYERPKKVQKFYGDGSDILVVSNHINAGGGDGAEVIYALRNNDTFAKKIAKELEIAGQNVRKYYQRRLPSNPNKDYYYILRNTPNNETVIVEYGFADSKGDDIDQIKNGWEKLAEGVVKAIVEYASGLYIAPKNAEYYTVKKGETLWSISKKLGITIQELKDANNLQSNLLSIGQNLIIPKEENNPKTEVEYIVKKGDTLYSIASKFNISINDLKRINNLTNDILSIGQVLIIEEGSEENEKNIDTYTVKKGDTLWNIAQKFNINVDNLKSFNNLETDNLSIGQILNIPSNTPISDNKIYIVKKGDNLYSIAMANNTTVSQLVDLNNLVTSDLSIGQILLVP